LFFNNDFSIFYIKYKKKLKGSYMNRKQLLKQIKQAVHEVEPNAEIILYGSRSRGDAVSESDWDFLILVDGPLSDDRTDRIRHRLYEVEWESEEVISSIIRNREQWHSSSYQAMPFHQKVEQEGIRL
jgi:uncharacterized protein